MLDISEKICYNNLVFLYYNVYYMKIKEIFTSKAFLAFISGALMYILVVLPELISQDGILMYVGDYTTQLMPFTYHIRDSVLSGNVIWDHSPGLGSQFLSSYAYYNLCSPFNIFYLIVPRAWIIYAIPYVTAIKYGTGAMFAYLYLKRFLDNGHFAVIGGVLYSLSSFSAYNMVYHFIDVIALFPLMLIALEELCTRRRRGLFAISCALMAYVNYFFFFGQAVFVVIYYFVRGADKEFGISVKQFFSVALEAIVGVMLAAPMLIPVAFTLMGSEKATEMISASDMLFYDDIFHYLKLMQSSVMVPDGFHFMSFFPENDKAYPNGTLGASVAAYLPLFSVAGVISYIFANRKRWTSILLVVCAVMALVPVLNQAFSAFNNAYYARWFYMPILIASLVSLKALEDKISFKPGVIVCAVLLGLFILYQIFVDTEELITSVTANGTIIVALNYIHLAVSVIGLVTLIVVVMMKRDGEFIQKLYIIAFANVYLCYGIMTYYTLSFNDFDSFDKYYNISSEDEHETSADRVLLCSGMIVNYNLAFGEDSPAYFNSIYDNGHIRFLEENELKSPRGTYESVSIRTRELMDIVSVKYYYDIPNSEGIPEDMTYAYDRGAYVVYENDNSIPMGYTYDHVISHEDFAKLPKEDKYRVYAKYLVADDVSVFDDILDVYSGDLSISDEEYERQIALRQENAALSTEPVRDGYVSQLELDAEKLVFYSVSYNDNWKAYIDGEETEVYEVNNGLIGVRVPEGKHELKLSYTVKGAMAGAVVFGAGAVALVLYMCISKRRSQSTE